MQNMWGRVRRCCLPSVYPCLFPSSSCYQNLDSVQVRKCVQTQVLSHSPSSPCSWGWPCNSDLQNEENWTVCWWYFWVNLWLPDKRSRLNWHCLFPPPLCPEYRLDLWHSISYFVSTMKDQAISQILVLALQSCWTTLESTFLWISSFMRKTSF